MEEYREIALSMLENRKQIPVSGVLTQEVADILQQLFFKAKRDFGMEEVTLLIDSPGGNSFAMGRVANTMSECGLKFTGRVLGKASSAAFILLQLCDVREAYPFADLMGHWGGMGFDNNELTAIYEGEIYPVEHLKSDMHNLISVLERRTGIEEKKWASWFGRERCFYPKEALENGLLDRIVPLKSVADKDKIPASLSSENE